MSIFEQITIGIVKSWWWEIPLILVAIFGSKWDRWVMKRSENVSERD
jgi:hypothetical protein